MKKKIVLAMALTLLLTGCGKVPKLENGKDAVVSFKNGDKISVDDLYTQMKDKYALSILVNMIDKKVLEETFKDNIEKAKKASESYLSALKESYDSEEKLLSAIQQYYGFSTLEEYKDQIYLSYMQSYAVEAYAKEKITDKEIENYYKNMENDIEVSHILITPQVTDKMNDDEKKKAETEAETKAKSIITELKDAVKKGSSVADAFSELAKKYSEDESTKDKGGSLGEVNKTKLGDSYTNLINKAYTLKDGAYSTEVVKTDNGYHVIMRNKTYDKKDLKDVKQQIIETLAKEKMKKDSFIITAEGYLKLEEELNELKNVRRPQIIKALKDARAQGDLSENSDYDAARDAQGKVESRIKELEYRLEHSEIAKIEKGGKVSVGSTVTIDDDGDEDTYKIVGSAEADAFNNLISNVSPLGQALMSHKEGDIVTVESPNGQYSVKILKVC